MSASAPPWSDGSDVRASLSLLHPAMLNVKINVKNKILIFFIMKNLFQFLRHIDFRSFLCRRLQYCRLLDVICGAKRV